jgi:hypothetical protein
VSTVELVPAQTVVAPLMLPDTAPAFIVKGADTEETSVGEAELMRTLYPDPVGVPARMGRTKEIAVTSLLLVPNVVVVAKKVAATV